MTIGGVPSRPAGAPDLLFISDAHFGKGDGQPVEHCSSGVLQ
jgi:hypothetical protein